MTEEIWHEIDGAEDVCDSECRGWDGVSSRCDCGCVRPYWETIDEDTKYVNFG